MLHNTHLIVLVVADAPHQVGEVLIKEPLQVATDVANGDVHGSRGAPAPGAKRSPAGDGMLASGSSNVWLHQCSTVRGSECSDRVGSVSI